MNRFLQALSHQKPPLVIAHRGDCSHAPENTIEAAILGFEAGAEAWELDVQLTRDGVPMAIHDESLTRTTDVSVRFKNDPRSRDGCRLSDFDFDEVRSLDAGSWFVSTLKGCRGSVDFETREELGEKAFSLYNSGAVRIPSLRECLELTRRLDWLVNVELKTFPNTDSRLLPAVIEIILELGVAERVLISSFDHADVAHSAALELPIATGVLTMSPLFRPADYIRGIVGADCYHASSSSLGVDSDHYRTHPSPSRLRMDDLEALKAANVPVLVYTVNDARQGGIADNLWRAGVCGLFTDRPGDMRRLVGSRDRNRVDS